MLEATFEIISGTTDWGEIKGNIEDQSDLINLVNDTKSDIEQDISDLADTINARIDDEVENLEEQIAEVTNNIEGSDLIDVTKENQTVTITSKTFVFEQGIASNTWVINHNLNKRPSITLTNANGEVFEAYRDYVSNNQVIIRLNAANTGFAYLN